MRHKSSKKTLTRKPLLGIAAMLPSTGDTSEKTSKTNGLSFKPPAPWPWFQRIIRFLLPVIFDKCLGEFHVQIDEQSLARLKSIRGERTLLLPNHPAQWDPWVMLGLSRLLEDNFYFVVAREIFDWLYGIQGWALQRMGCYSVVRGANDKESFRTTKQIMSQNKGPLVIFVEGEISIQSDSLLPLEPGVVHLAFLSLLDIYKRTGRALDRLPSLYVCPVAITYFYDPRGLDQCIERAICRLEEATDLDIGSEGLSRYERIRNLSLYVLDKTASRYDYPIDYSQSLADQVKGLEHVMLTWFEQVVNLPHDCSLSYLDRVRRIRNTIDRMIKDPPVNRTKYENRLYEHQKAVVKNFYWDLERIVNFIAIYDGYIHPDMSSKRFVEVIRRLEKEVLGDYHLRHPRTAVIRVLEYIDLKYAFQDFLQDKRKTTKSLIQQIERDIYRGIIAT